MKNGQTPVDLFKRHELGHMMIEREMRERPDPVESRPILWLHSVGST